MKALKEKIEKKGKKGASKEKRIIGSYNEWGKLREAFVGIAPDNMVCPSYLPAFRWMPKRAIEETKKQGGKLSKNVAPDMMKLVKKQIKIHVEVLEEFGVKVHRNIQFRYPEEEHFLDDTQKGLVISGGADFFRVIGNNVILLNNLRYPFRRKQMYTIRPVLEPLLKDTNARYVALPPASPHYSEDDIYLENGDIMVDGYNVYVGMSGNATNQRGVWWLKQFLGPEYRVYIIKLASNILHLDTALTLNRTGLLTYYPKLVGGLPKPLKHWDKIEVFMEKGEEEVFGANHLSLDENTIVVASEYDRLNPEFRRRGMEVINIPLSASMYFGSGARCLTGVLRRDP